MHHNNLGSIFLYQTIWLYEIKVHLKMNPTTVSWFHQACFLILLKYNIWPPHPNCDVSDPEFVLRVNLRRHNTSAYYKATVTELRYVCSQIYGRSESKDTWYFDMNCNECNDDFLLRVKLRRHIRSGPQKPAPSTCLY